MAVLAVLDGIELTVTEQDAVDLLAVVAGQDVERGDDGVFRIVREGAGNTSVLVRGAVDG